MNNVIYHVNNGAFEYLTTAFGTKETGTGQLLVFDGECPFCGKVGNNKIYFSMDKMEEYVKPSGCCFHCGKGFSVLAFVAAYEGVSTNEALGILNNSDSGFVRTKKEMDNQGNLCVDFPSTAVTILPGTEGHRYLLSRGIDDKMIRHFDLRVCNDDCDDSDGNRLYVKDRIIFPICGEDGEIVSWQGRDITGKKKNKYLFPKSFGKHNYVYNCNKIKDNDYLIVCEGVMDVIGWYKHGFTNAIATFGKVMSKVQLSWLLNHGFKTVYMAWDSDASANKQKFMRDYKDHFQDMRCIELSGKDADECDKEYLCQALSSASSFSWSSWVLGKV